MNVVNEEACHSGRSLSRVLGQSISFTSQPSIRTADLGVMATADTDSAPSPCARALDSSRAAPVSRRGVACAAAPSGLRGNGKIATCVLCQEEKRVYRFHKGRPICKEGWTGKWRAHERRMRAESFALYSADASRFENNLQQWRRDNPHMTGSCNVPSSPARVGAPKPGSPFGSCCVLPLWV
jgi:hypothetical protein